MVVNRHRLAGASAGRLGNWPTFGFDQLISICYELEILYRFGQTFEFVKYANSDHQESRR